MKRKERIISVVVAVNNEEVLHNNLLKSPDLKNKKISIVKKKSFESASKAFNDALYNSDSDIFVFAHQDVYLPTGWFDKLDKAINNLESNGINWGVLGVIGKNSEDMIIGKLWSNGLQTEIKSEKEGLQEAVSFDEVVIIVNGKKDLYFDSGLPGFHLYGTDIVLIAGQKKLRSFVFDGPVIHNSLPVIYLDSNYRKVYNYMKKKWIRKLPLSNTVASVTVMGWPYHRNRLSWMKKKFFGEVPRREDFTRNEDPEKIAKELKY